MLKTNSPMAPHNKTIPPAPHIPYPHKHTPITQRHVRPPKDGHNLHYLRPPSSAGAAGAALTSETAHAHAQRTEQLLQSTNLLTLAYHRNKNQHRRSRWWKELGMLKRNLRRVVRRGDGDGDGGATAIGVSFSVGKGEDKAPRTGKKKGNKLGGADEAARRRKEVEEAAAAEEEKGKVLDFVRTRLMPRCWVAFSGLVADTQYAGLGLMLLGTLGRLTAVMGWESGREEEEEWGIVDAKAVGGDEIQEAEIVAEKGGEFVRSGEDLGVPLVREEVMDSEELQIIDAEKMAVEVDNGAGTTENKTLSSKKKKKKGKKKHHDAIDELFSGLI